MVADAGTSCQPPFHVSVCDGAGFHKFSTLRKTSDKVW